MKKLIFSFFVMISAVLAWAQPARLPINEPNSGNPTTKPGNNNTTTTGNSNSNSGSEMKKYSDPNGRFTIGYPTDWQLDDKPETTLIQIFSPLENDKDNFRQNVNLIIDNANNTTLESYVKLNMDGIKESMKGYKEVSSMYFTRNGSRAYQVVYKGRYNNMSYDIQIKQLFMLSNGKAYILTYASKADERDAFETTSNKIFNSFKY
jgi:hypothetical protein